MEGWALNVSEGGMLSKTVGPVLPTHLPLVIRFTLEEISFAIDGYVVWSKALERQDEIEIESALAFDDPGSQAEVLRPLLFQAQLTARRAEML
jgi:hypothetical protein